jgi:hypothetical protein
MEASIGSSAAIFRPPPPMRFFRHEGPIPFGAVHIGLAMHLLLFADGRDLGLFSGVPFCRARVSVRHQRAQEQEKKEQSGPKVAHTVSDGCHAAKGTIGRGS